MQEAVAQFEKKIAEFFGAPYAVATDSCTSSIELCLRMLNAKYISCPKHTYLSVPMLSKRIGIDLKWRNETWQDYYQVYPKVFDAAVLWKRNSYLEGTFMCVSMQFQKQLSVGRLGIILTDRYLAYQELKRMSYDGREPGIPWREQNVKTWGYHCYATPETCQIALDKLPEAIATKPRQWRLEDWPDLTQMEVFR